MTKPVLKLQGFEKRRGEFRLGPLDFSIDEGLVVALVGPNGSGKSTLFRSLMGLLHPERGSLELFGGGSRLVTSDARRTEAELRDRGIAALETRAVELEDILWHLMENDKRKSGSV